MSGEGGSAPPSRVVGRYQILREIGRGGMAVVYVAMQPDLDRQVALKELGAFHAGSAEFAHRFLRESRLAGSLNHPNIVTVHEYFEHDGTPYIAMEFVPRGSLRPYMKRLTLAQIGGVLEGVLAALAHAETAAIVHRDLKPENIMVTADGRVKITDFGIARATERAGTQFMTATGMTVGTPAYMAPEQAMAGDVGPWTDLYSVGVLAYELLVGHVPFHDTDAPVVILMRHVNERIPPPIEVRPEVDPGLSHWVDSLLVKDPQERVRHAATAWESFEDILVGLLGPLWRRNARLLDDDVAAQGAQPLTPAPFESRPVRTPTPTVTTIPEAFVTFGSEAADDGAAAAADAEPVAEVAPPPGAANEPAAEPAPASDRVVDAPVAGAESEFVTFAAPGAAAAPAVAPQAAPQPPSDAAGDAPATAEVAEETPPATASDVPVAEPQFVTYGRPTAQPPAETPAPETPAATPSATPEPEAEPEPPEPSSETMAPFATPPAPAAAASAAAEPERPIAAAEPAVSAARARRTPIAILALVLAAAAAAVGFLVAPSHKKPAPAPAALSQHAAAGPLRISYPAGWSRAASVPAETSALGLSQAVALAPGASATGAALVVGTSNHAGPTLLSPAFARTLPSKPEGAAVKLGSLTFMRYLYLVPRDAATPESVYALPTTRGTATAVCVAPRSGVTRFAATCERAIATMTTGATVLPLGANPAYARDASAIVARLNAATATSGHRLAGAGNRKAQASAATALSRANAAAAAAFAKLTPGPAASAANAAIVSALRRVGTAYGKLARAAAANDAAAYSSARLAIGVAESGLGAAFVTLQQAGYTLG